MSINNLIVLYDSNNTTLDGNKKITFTENVSERFRAMGWHVEFVKNGNSVSEINEAIIALEKGARFKSDFLSSMSHEIKTPLNSILYTFRDLDDNYNLNYNVRRDINDIVFASNRLQEIISNILININKETYTLRFNFNLFNKR